MDVPVGLQNLITDEALSSMTSYSFFVIGNNKEAAFDAKSFDTRISSFQKKNLALPKFWQVRKDNIHIVLFLL